MSEPATYDDLPRRTSTLERATTVLLIVALAAFVPIASFMGLLTSMASDGCTTSSCNSGLIGLGVLVSAASPAVAFLAALVLVVVRWRRGRTTWWVPLAAVVAGAAGWALGAAITVSAVD